MDSTPFLAALSHTPLGLVPLALSIALGVAAYFAERRWRVYRRVPLLLLLLGIWFYLILSVLLVLAGLFHVGCAQIKARDFACYTRSKELGVAAMLYAQDHHDTLPSVENWETELKPYLKEPIRCPIVKQGTGYAMNKALSQKKLDAVELPAETVLFFETEDGTTLATGRHGGRHNLVFADGHSKGLSTLSSQTLRWK